MRTHPPISLSFPAKLPPPPAQAPSILGSRENLPELAPNDWSPTESVGTADLLAASHPLVTIDSTRSSALSPSKHASFPALTLSPLGSGGGGRTGGPAKAQPTRLPNTTFDLDARALPLHLALRCAEVRALSEPMWDWVRNAQRVRGKGASSSSSGASEAVRELTREEFETLLGNFDM
jgi:hypothetical protein